MKKSKSKVAAPQSIDELGKEVLAFCKTSATKKETSFMIAELEEMKVILEAGKHKFDRKRSIRTPLC